MDVGLVQCDKIVGAGVIGVRAVSCEEHDDGVANVALGDEVARRGQRGVPGLLVDEGQRVDLAPRELRLLERVDHAGRVRRGISKVQSRVTIAAHPESDDVDVGGSRPIETHLAARAHSTERPKASSASTSIWLSPGASGMSPSNFVSIGGRNLQPGRVALGFRYAVDEHRDAADCRLPGGGFGADVRPVPITRTRRDAHLGCGVGP